MKERERERKRVIYVTQAESEYYSPIQQFFIGLFAIIISGFLFFVAMFIPLDEHQPGAVLLVGLIPLVLGILTILGKMKWKIPEWGE